MNKKDDDGIGPLKYDSNNNGTTTSTISTISTIPPPRERKQHSFWLNEHLYQSFKRMARLLGRRSTAQAAQEAFQEWMEHHVDELPGKPVINIIDAQHVNITLVKRLELKLIKRDLRLIIHALQAKQGSQPFFLGKLKDLLPKALRIYEKTSDADLEHLLKQTEQWM